MSSLAKVTTAIRIGIVIIAAGLTSVTVLHLASMPPPPPESDGFAHGMAAMIGGGLILGSLTLASLTIITPTLLGRSDPLGFSGRQRLALKVAGGMIGLGILIALLMGLTGVLYLLALLGLAFGIVFTVLLWRLGEVVAQRRTKTS